MVIDQILSNDYSSSISNSEGSDEVIRTPTSPRPQIPKSPLPREPSQPPSPSSSSFTAPSSTIQKLINELNNSANVGKSTDNNVKNTIGQGMTAISSNLRRGKGLSGSILNLSQNKIDENAQSSKFPG